MLNVLSCMTSVTPAIELRPIFEKHFSSFGFSLACAENDDYISEITQAAWIGFSLLDNLSNDTRDTDVPGDGAGESVKINTIERFTVTPDSPKADLSNLDVTLFFAGQKEVETQEFNSLPNAHPLLVSEDEEREAIKQRVFRSTGDKLEYSTGKEEKKEARAIADKSCKPMWIYAQGNKRLISSHGFDLTRRPDVTPSMAQINEVQLQKRLQSSRYAPAIKPSVVARFGYNGKHYQQMGRYIDTHVVAAWIANQDSPAIFISIPAEYNDQRKDMIFAIQDDLRESYGVTSSYRWITSDTILLSTNNDPTDYMPARRKVENPHFLHTAFSRPNTPVIK